MQTPITHVIILVSQAQGAHAACSSVEEHLEHHRISCSVHVLNTPSLPKPQSPSSLVLCIGGDGSLLQAAHYAITHNLPIIGYNLGKIGFLADLTPKTLPTLSDTIHSEHQLERRSLLALRSPSTTSSQPIANAVNDITITRSQRCNTIAFSVIADNTVLASHHADGLIIASPTGSTGYNLSAGGPIVHPSNSVLLVNTICTHKLSSRPLILPDHTPLTIKLHSTIDDVVVHVDGKNIPQESLHTQLIVTKAPEFLTLMHPKSYCFYNTLKTKLHWESHHAR